MISKPIDKIEWSDLESLIDDQISERRTIDYKRSLPSNSDDDKKNFLYDVSSFANTVGGDLIYGIVEQGGFQSNCLD
jgi:predicted HTH transcriptional regulator